MHGKESAKEPMRGIGSRTAGGHAQLVSYLYTSAKLMGDAIGFLMAHVPLGSSRHAPAKCLDVAMNNPGCGDLSFCRKDRNYKHESKFDIPWQGSHCNILTSENLSQGNHVARWTAQHLQERLLGTKGIQALSAAAAPCSAGSHCVLQGKHPC